MSETGSQSANFHKGTRSEYLAHYVFSSFGTCVPVPHPEDTGIDLHCTLTETIGQRIWPLAYYFVQVKSTEKPWKFNSRKSVEQFLTLPLPIFLCIVTKDDLRLRVYSTGNRLSILREIPDELLLFPGDVSDEGNRWHDETNGINLEQPILNFTLNEIVDPAFASKAKEILNRTITEEAGQILLRKIGVPVFETSSHATNEVKMSGRRGHALLKPSPEQERAFDHTLRRMLSWLQHSMIMSDARGQWRLGILEHHLHTEASRGRLRERGPLHSIIRDYLRNQREAHVRDTHQPSLTETLDNMLDDVIHALIDESVAHPRKSRRLHHWDCDDEEEGNDEEQGDSSEAL